MSNEVTTTSNPEQRITIDRPVENTGKSKSRVEAGKRLAEYNKAMKKKKESGETTDSKEPLHSESNCENDNEEMSGTTKTLLLLGAAGLGYYLYTTTTNNGKKEVVRQQQPTVQNNNEVQENTVSRLRSFKN